MLEWSIYIKQHNTLYWIIVTMCIHLQLFDTDNIWISYLYRNASYDFDQLNE